MIKRKNTRGLGPRYGRKVRQNLSKILLLKNAKQQCPHCRYDGVKRVAAGIWECSKCDKKFTGKAYTIGNGFKHKEAQ